MERHPEQLPGVEGFKRAFLAGDKDALNKAGEAFASVALILAALDMTLDEAIAAFDRGCDTQQGEELAREKTQSFQHARFKSFLMT